jgi:hypothetical protein
MRSALHYPASTSTSSGGFVESARTAGLTSRPQSGPLLADRLVFSGSVLISRHRNSNLHRPYLARFRCPRWKPSRGMTGRGIAAECTGAFRHSDSREHPADCNVRPWANVPFKCAELQRLEGISGDRTAGNHPSTRRCEGPGWGPGRRSSSPRHEAYDLAITDAEVEHRAPVSLIGVTLVVFICSALASHSSPVFAHLYYARPGRNVKIACPAKPWKSRHLSTNSSAATVRPQLPASSRLRRRSEPRRCRSTGAPEGCHSPPDGAQPEPP